ncbi:MauE/DoxX family redox-associated membrane protein [Nocardia huaxiensis]|uniref:MauE/DoxX family redox-associated membrane protein n=1 Tax=Nocardia huaxiensis TaxID=2755382 RepID=UPI001E45C89A|nr:MauE/DoxX family redox-associated membrane protein [Nocardia huaxiensis]UFS94671.1 redoxin domain-containing protein [Nocardia huaxiensis]
MLIDYMVWAARLALSAVFGLSAWAKFIDLPGTRKAVGEFGIALRWVPWVAWVLPTGEAVVAVAVLPPWTAVGGAALAITLLGVFTASMVRLLRAGKRPACSCFGSVSATPIGWDTVARNGGLGLLALLVLVGTAARPHVPGVLPVDHAVGMAVAAVLVAVLMWLGGLVFELRRRLDQQVLSTLGAEGLPAGAVAPEFELARTDGGRTDLAELLAGGRQLLLVFVHPACEMCAALARELPRWHARTAGVLTIAVVGNGEVAEYTEWKSRQQLGGIPVLVQQGNEASLRYRVRGTPSAVLIGADGRVAAPVARGAMAIRDLIVQSKRTVPRSNPERNGSVL